MQAALGGHDGARGGQVVTVAGLVDDDVAKLKLFPAIGAPRTVPSNDNGYFIVNASGSVWQVRSTSGGICLAFTLAGETGLGTGCDETVTPRGLNLGIGSDRSRSWVAVPKLPDRLGCLLASFC